MKAMRRVLIASLMKSFDELKLPAPISKALHAMAFEIPTPVQAQAIPPGLAGHDVLGTAQTGTGKTAAFCIPILVRLMARPEAMALVLVPTRELARQIDEHWKRLTQFVSGVNGACLIGGMSMKAQVRAIKSLPRFIVATPGRLIDHLGRKEIHLRSLEVLVLDEADRMLDMGFAPQLNRILQAVPEVRQTMLFSATMEPDMNRLAARYLRHPVRVAVGTVSQAAVNVLQSAIETTAKQKNELLLNELNKCKGSVLIFVRTQARTDRVARFLNEYGLEVNLLHGGRTQIQRNSAMQAFKSGKTRILVATDIAARGIDVAGIGHIINYDLPHVPEDYIHRIGRTARAGLTGHAISFVTPEEREQWRAITQLLQKVGSPVPEIRRSV